MSKADPGPSPMGPSLSPLWVLAGVPFAVLAMVDRDGSGVWWAVSSLAGWLWGLPHVAEVAVWLAVAVAALGALAFAWKAWKRWSR